MFFGSSAPPLAPENGRLFGIRNRITHSILNGMEVVTLTNRVAVGERTGDVLREVGVCHLEKSTCPKSPLYSKVNWTCRAWPTSWYPRWTLRQQVKSTDQCVFTHPLDVSASIAY